MSTVQCPSYMTPVSRLAKAPVRMAADIEKKLDDDGSQKTNENFPGRSAWKARVSCIFGAETITMPDGSQQKTLQTETYPVTIWATAEEAVQLRQVARAGRWVRLLDLMAGAVQGNLYLQALGIVENAQEKEQVKK